MSPLFYAVGTSEGLEDRCNDFINYLIKIRLANYTKFTNDIALSVAGNDLALYITWFTKITSTHAFLKRITILWIDVGFGTNQYHLYQSFFVLLKGVIGYNNSRMNFCLSIREEEIDLYNVALFICHIKYILR